MMSGFAWYAGRAGLAHRFGSREFGRREPTDSRMLATSAPDWDALLDRFRDGSARPVLLAQDRADRIAAERPAEVKALIAEAERFLAGERVYFGYVKMPSSPAVRLVSTS